MLDKTTFVEYFDKMKANFQRNIPDRWINYYWEDLQYWNSDEFVETCEHIINADEWFPKKKRFNQVRSKLRADKHRGAPVGAAPCDMCDGYGYIYIENRGGLTGTFYRARCEHGAKHGFLDLAPEGIGRAEAQDIWLTNHWEQLSKYIDVAEKTATPGIQEFIKRAREKIAKKREEYGTPF